MPQAALADSTTAREDQPLMVDLERFEDTINELDALTLMLASTLEQGGGFHRSIVSGISCLFRGRVTDFQEIYDSIISERKHLMDVAPFQRALNSLAGPTPTAATFEYIERRILKGMGTMGNNIGFTVHGPVLKLLDHAAKDFGYTTQGLMRLIIVQWLVREGWLGMPEATEGEEGK